MLKIINLMQMLNTWCCGAIDIKMTSHFNGLGFDSRGRKLFLFFFWWFFFCFLSLIFFSLLTYFPFLTDLKGGPLFFDGGWGGGWKISHPNFFYMRLLLQTVFLVSPSSCKNYFFTCLQFISVFTASANNLFQNIPGPHFH